ncbi:MAG: Fic family protein [Pseudomonadales bacterium]
MMSLVAPPTLTGLLASLPAAAVRDAMAAGIATLPEGRYLHWDQLRHLPPPPGFGHEAWWLAIKLARLAVRQGLSLPPALGGNLWFSVTGSVLARLQQLDHAAWAGTGADWPPAAARAREAAGSAALTAGAEGVDARAAALLRVEADADGLGERALTVADLQSLHRGLNAGPSAADPGLLAAICDLANAALPLGLPLHPVVRAAALQFLLVDRRPFAAGNGRIGRLLGGWAMRRAGYPLVLAPSAALSQAPSRYRRAFAWVASDDRDLTYLIDLLLRSLLQSLAAWRDRAARQAQSLARAEGLLGDGELNPRQRHLLAHALAHPGHRYRIASHRDWHGVTYQTARTDLLGLAAQGLLVPGKRGRAFVFTAPADLAARLRTRA